MRSANLSELTSVAARACENTITRSVLYNARPTEHAV
jgi:hypothetical protein